MRSAERRLWRAGHTFWLIRIVMLAGSLMLGCAGAEPNSRLFSATHAAMGTTFSLYIYAPSQIEASKYADLVFDEVDRVEDLLSNYRQTSELSRLNQEAASSAVTTDPETLHFLERSLSWSERSGGAFDITVGKLMKAWGFFNAQGRVPTAADLAQVRNEVGWHKVQLNSAERTVHFLSPGLELDPGGIGKGYAVERAVELLRSEHVAAALLSAGNSTIYALGAPPGETGWKVRVPALTSAERTLSTVILHDTSLSTANCSEKHFVQNAHLYCHIMDPITLRPVEGVLQVTVIAPSATDSDALSNVLFVLGAKAGTPILQKVREGSALVLSGRQTSVKCHLIGWKASLDPGYCSEISSARQRGK